MNYILKNAVVVNEGSQKKGTVKIKDGYIEDIEYDPAKEKTGQTKDEAGYEVVDLRGLYLLPGIIDDQVHFREPGLTHKGSIATESLAAVKGGVTSFMEMPNTKPQTLTQSLLEEKYERAARTSLTNYSFYMGCSEDNIEEVLKTDPRKVCGIKLFLGSSTGNMLVQDPLYLERLFSESPCLIAAHCEEEPLIRRQTEIFRARYGSDAPFSIHPQIRNEEACFRSSSKAAALARKHGARLHILHISTARELELLDPVPSVPNDDPYRSVGISGEICVHYLWFCDRDYERFGWRMKCNPAIKTEADRHALRQAVKSGQVVLATDHAPHTFEEKQKSYFECPSGSPWVQHSLPMMLELVHRGIFTIEEVVNAMCHRPAQCFNLHNRGFLRKGYAADIAVVDPEKTWTVNTANIAYSCGWSALENQTLHGKVEYTFVNGNMVFAHDRILLPEHRGERLLFR